MGVTLGERPPRLAHRVLGDVREAPRDQLRDPRRRHGPRVPTPRERDRAVTRARPRLRADLDAQRHAEHGRGGDAQVRRQRRAPDGGARPVRAGDRAALLHDRSVAEASRLLGSDPDRGEGAGRDAPQRAAGRDRARAATGTRSPQCWRTTSTRRRRSRSCTSGHGPGPSRSFVGGSTCSGSAASPTGRRRRPRSSTLAEARIVARASRDFAEADRLRDEIAAHGWEVRDVAAGYELVPRA